MVTVFNSLTEPNKPAYAEVEVVLEQIRTGGKIKKKIIQLRELALLDEPASEKVKRTLPGICFGGKYRTRNLNDLIEASGYMILDFDDSPPELADQLKEDEFIHSFFLSPRGNGFKALVQIPIVKSNEEYKSYFMAFAKRYVDTLDVACCDLVRFCFFSYDPNIVIKAEPKVWSETVDTKEVQPDTNTQSSKSVKSNYKKIAVGLEMIAQAEVGNRHNTIIKAGRLMGGYIGSGEVNESDVLSVFEREIEKKDPEDFRQNWKTFLTGIGHGKQDPLNSTKEIEIEKKIGKIDHTLDMAVLGKLMDIYNNGYKKGYHVGWDCLSELYTVVLGYTTYLYGSPFSGKTYWWLEVLINLSRHYKLRHCIFSPETGTHVDVFKTLIEIAGEGDFVDRYGNKMPEQRRDEVIKWLSEYFIIVDPEDEDISVKDLLDYVDILERKYDTKIHTVTIDPWNELEHDDDRNVRALEKELKLVRRNAKKNNRHICVITHIRDQDPIKDGTTVYYPIPTPRDIMGGQTWYRKGFMMISFWRLMIFHKDVGDTIRIGKREFKKNATLIQIQKAKPNGVGKLGEVEMFWDSKTHRFYEENGKYSHHIDDKEEREKISQKFSDKPDDETPF